MKRLLLLLLLLLPVLCAAQERVLHFWAVTGSVLDVRMYRHLAADFTKKTGVKVEVTPLAWGNFETKYFAAMAAGLPPDVGVTNLGGPFNYGSVGGLVDLRSEFPKESKELLSHFDPKLLGMFTIGDKLYAVPSDLSTLLMYYRTDVFQRLGLQPPKTWSELNRTLGALEANGYHYYFGFTAGAQWAIGLYTMPYDLSNFAFDAQGRPIVNWSQPKYVDGVMEAMRLWNLHDSPGKDLGSRVIGMFRSNDKSSAVPFMLDLHTVYSNIQFNAPELKGKWDVAPWPKADDGKPFNIMGGTTYVVFRKSTMKKEAMQWLLYLNSLPAQQAMILDRLDRGDESGLMVSPVKEVWEPANDAFWRRPETQKVARLVEVMKQVIPQFGTVPSIQGSVEASRLESNLLDQMATYVRDGLDDIAGKHDMSRWDVVRAFGAGKMDGERTAFEKRIHDKLAAGYGKITPKGQALLREQTARYSTRFGDVIGEIPKYERMRSVMDVVKALAGLLLVGAALGVGFTKRLRKYWLSYMFVAPPLVLAVVFVFVPAVVALYLSFTDYHPVLPLSTAKWVGVQNYLDVVHGGDLTNSLLRTIRYALWTLPVGVVLSLILAFLLNQNLAGERFWRFLYFSPLVTSVVSTALIFSQLFLGGKQGWLNAMLLSMGLIRDPIQFLTSERTFMNCVIVLAIWQGLAFTILVFLAGLQQIPAQLYEAAAMDGAGPLSRFRNVAVPGLRPQVFFVTVLGLIGSFQVFETIYVLAGKSGDAGARFGPNDAALTMVPLVYHTGFETFEMGKSTAIAYILFILILALTAIQMRFYRGGEA